MTEEDYLRIKDQLQHEITFYEKHFPFVAKERKRRLEKLERDYGK